MNPILPTKDEWTTYDYDVGAKRMAGAKEGRYQFLQMIDISCPGMPHIINFNDQLEYMKRCNAKASSRLQVTGPDGFSTDFKQYSKQKTLELASKSISRWGKESAEKVLSATKTGSLYFHIIHHFGSYENFLEKIEDNNEIK